MNPSRKKYTRERGIGRRKEDWLLREHLHRYTQLFHVGQIITSEINMEVLFEVIMDQTNQIMDTERSTVFLYDDKSEQLWSLVATGMKKNEISIPPDYGIAGWVFQHKTALIDCGYSVPGYQKIPQYYGLTVNPEGGISLDGGCGIESIRKIIAACGFEIESVGNSKGHVIGYLIEKVECEA